jgi:hypothetical protein
MKISVVYSWTSSMYVIFDLNIAQGKWIGLQAYILLF